MPAKSKKLSALLCALLLLPFSVLAEINWPGSMTPGQEKLKRYIETVNADLDSLQAAPVNKVFELYPSAATLGITADDSAEIPEGVELTFTMYPDELNILTLRVNDPERFAAIAAACIHAASPDACSLNDAMADPARYVKKVKEDRYSSISDQIIEQNGISPRTYYAYYPDQYHDGQDWMQLTIVFPLAGYGGGAVVATPVPAVSDGTTEYEGFTPTDDRPHYEIFTTATPEPDSPAASGWDTVF